MRTPSKAHALSNSAISPITQSSSNMYKTPTKSSLSGPGFLSPSSGGGNSSRRNNNNNNNSNNNNNNNNNNRHQRNDNGASLPNDSPSSVRSMGTLSPSPSIPTFRRVERRMSGRRFRAPTPRILLTEWIMKAPTRRGLWIFGGLRKHHRRWCVLRTDLRQGALLVYYDSNNRHLQRRKGMLRIDGDAQVVRQDEFTFTLTSGRGRRSFQGTCDTPEICSKWVTEITNCIRFQPDEPAVVRTCC